MGSGSTAIGHPAFTENRLWSRVVRALPVLLITVLTAALATPASAAVRDDTRSVDPLIGSAGGGNTYPGAVRPFGMISWSPTSTRGDQTNTGAANGYAYDATRVRGFRLRRNG